VSEPKGRGVAWTEERGTSDEGRRGLKSAPEASGKHSMTDEPIPHWPGRLVDLGDHQVFVRSAAGQGEPARPDPARPEPAHTEPALCVHGLEGSSRNWTDLLDLLRPTLAGEALDLPGFGDSPPRADGRYSIAALAQTVTMLIEKQRRGPVHLIGNSLGGAVCVRVAATRPELIRTLTLISPALPDLRPRLDLVRFPLMSLPWFGGRVIRQYQVLPPERRVADVIATCFSDPGLFPRDRFAAEVAELTRRDSLGYATAALTGSVRTLSTEFLRQGRHSAWRDAARITAPSLVIYGSRDRVVDPRNAGRAAHAFKNAKIVVLPHTGHVAQMERPGLVATEIGMLLAAASRGAGRGADADEAREFPLASAG
jgi:pimeloyl-ACP methyl ester carboxylesterase